MDLVEIAVSKLAIRIIVPTLIHEIEEVSRRFAMDSFVELF